MARMLKILAYAVILFLLYLVITGFLKSCNNDSKVASASVENTIESESGDEFFEEEEFEGEENTLFADNVGEIEEIDYEKIDKAVERRTGSNSEETNTNVEKKEKPARSKPSNPTNYDDSSGSYMVIAGNYIINTNAENMVLKLKKNGYNNAEIVIFDMSQYHSVVANRFSDYNSAYNLAKQLEAKGIDSYVHRKK